MYSEDNNENNSFMSSVEENNLNDSFIPSQEENNSIEDNTTDMEESVNIRKSFIPDFVVEEANKKANYDTNEYVKPESTINSLIDNNSTDLYQSGPKVYAVEKQKSSIPVVILLTGVIILIAGYFVYTYMNMATKKMVCTSNAGTITLTYNKDTIVGYRADKITYNIYEQRTYADEIGIKQYLDEFENWFKETTKGSCKR